MQTAQITPLVVRPEIEPDEQAFQMFVLDEMAYEYEKRYDDVIRLTLGKSELPPNDVIVEAMVDALRTFEKSSLVFPAGLPELRERLADELIERYDVEVSPRNVVVNVGTSGLFRNIFYLLAGPGDEILLPKPYYPLYVFSATLAGARVTHYAIDTETMRIDFDSLEESLTDRTRVLVLNSPGNPLGNLVTREDYERMDEIVGGRCAILSDEIYANAVFEGEEFSALQAEERRSPLIVTSGFSKAHRMYSRRVGYAVVPDELVEPLTVIQHHTLLTTDPVPQFGALAALDCPDDVEALVARYKTRRDYTEEAFRHVPDVDALRSQGGFYLTLECSRFMRRHGVESSIDLAKQIMERTHVATVPGTDFGLPPTLRLSYSSARYEEGIDRLAAFFTDSWE